MVSIKVMADGGQGSLKICLTILPENYDPKLDRAPRDEDMEDLDAPPVKKRSTYASGGSVNSGKLTDVRKLLMLCIVPDVPETHSNMEILFNLTKINNISFTFVADLLLICIGCQTAVSTHPCPYCLIVSRI